MYFYFSCIDLHHINDRLTVSTKSGTQLNQSGFGRSSATLVVVMRNVTLRKLYHVTERILIIFISSDSRPQIPDTPAVDQASPHPQQTNKPPPN